MFCSGRRANRGYLPQTPDVSSDQSVHFDWEQRDFTQTIQLGMTQLTALLNEFGMRWPVTTPRRPHC
jgi:hypothetical protein